MPTTPYEVRSIIECLKNGKCPGADNITVEIIKNNKLFFSELLSETFNYCIQNGIYPDYLKVAQVIPIFKTGEKCNVGNYRPISTLSVLNKIIECLLYKDSSIFLKKIIFSINFNTVFVNLLVLKMP